MYNHRRQITIIDAIAPSSVFKYRILRDIVLVVAFVIITAAFARVAIPLPFTPVPITGQTFAVLLTGALLGSRRGALSMALYAVSYTHLTLPTKA